MKAWIQEEFGEPSEVLKWKEVPSLVPEKAQLKIRVLGAGLNFPDLLCIQGKYQVKPELPFRQPLPCDRRRYGVVGPRIR